MFLPTVLFLALFALHTFYGRSQLYPWLQTPFTESPQIFLEYQASRANSLLDSDLDAAYALQSLNLQQ